MLDKLFGGGAVKAVGKIIDEVYTSKEEAEQIKLEFAKVQARIQEKQLSINAIEARGNFMQRSWRPFLAWSCCLGLLYHTIIIPTYDWYLASNNILLERLPEFDMTILTTILFALLGLNVSRSWEKKNNLTK